MTRPHHTHNTTTERSGAPAGESVSTPSALAAGSNALVGELVSTSFGRGILTSIDDAGLHRVVLDASVDGKPWSLANGARAIAYLNASSVASARDAAESNLEEIRTDLNKLQGAHGERPAS